MTRFVVVGCGAVGGTVGGLLALAGHEVVFAVRAGHVDDLRRDGLELRLPIGRRRIRTDVADVERCRLHSDDIALVTVQSQDTSPALATLLAAQSVATDRPVVYCLQNGIGNEAVARRFTSDVHGGCVSMASVRLRPGVVLAHAAPRSGAVVVGRQAGGVDATDAVVVTALERSGIAARADGDVMRWKRAKLLRNLGNVVELVCGPGPARAAMYDEVRAEGERTLLAAGMPWTPDDVFEFFPIPSLSAVEVDGVPFAGNSTRQAFARGTPVETDYLNGAIVRLGRLHRVPTPVNAWVLDAARAGRVTPGPADRSARVRGDDDGVLVEAGPHAKR